MAKNDPFLPLLTKFQAKKKKVKFYFLFFIHVILHKFKKKNFFEFFIFFLKKWPKMHHWDFFSGEYEFLEKKGPRHALPLMKTQLHAKFQKN